MSFLFRCLSASLQPGLSPPLGHLAGRGSRLPLGSSLLPPPCLLPPTMPAPPPPHTLSYKRTGFSNSDALFHSSEVHSQGPSRAGSSRAARENLFLASPSAPGHLLALLVFRGLEKHRPDLCPQLHWAFFLLLSSAPCSVHICPCVQTSPFSKGRVILD